VLVVSSRATPDWSTASPRRISSWASARVGTCGTGKARLRGRGLPNTFGGAERGRMTAKVRLLVAGGVLALLTTGCAQRMPASGGTTGTTAPPQHGGHARRGPVRKSSATGGRPLPRGRCRLHPHRSLRPAGGQHADPDDGPGGGCWSRVSPRPPSRCWQPWP
jgi:hypothetical protein